MEEKRLTDEKYYYTITYGCQMNEMIQNVSMDSWRIWDTSRQKTWRMQIL